ncbi:MAG: RsmE family RNA methyltransferase [Anaerolineaceae bacterium]|nr:RsmE family RNA methyltransferase [Anaerolineaceae bacterium]
MPPRFFCPDLSATEVALEGDELHHLRTVRRLGTGAEVELFDGCGRLARCRLVRLDRRRAELEVLETAESEPPRLQLTIAAAVAKGNRMDFLVEKVTELGATALWPLVTARGSVTDCGQQKQLSWRRRSIEACKQCGRLFLPRIGPPLGLDEAIARMQAEPFDLVLLADLSGEAKAVGEVLGEAGAARRLIGLVGPEGGFSDSERRRLLALGGRAVRLAPTVLRVETAAVALAAAVAALG